MSVYVGDTETTGVDDGSNPPEVIELAFAPVTPGIVLGEITELRFKPKQAITYGAMAVHHIIPADLEGLSSYTPGNLPSPLQVLIGHNIDYDWKALGSPPGVKRICTLAMARAFWADGLGHSLGACMYRIREHANARECLRYAHSAATDVRNTFELFSFLVKGFGEKKGAFYTQWNDVWQLSEDCRIPRTWTFGKHKGRRIGEELGTGPDRGYHAWFMKQVDGDQYVQKAIAMWREGTL